MSKPDFDKVSEQIAVEIRKNIQIGSKHFASELQSYLSSNIECMFNEGRKAQMKVDAEIARDHGKQHSDRADELEAMPIDKFIDSRAKCNSVASFASISMECGLCNALADLCAWVKERKK